MARKASRANQCRSRLQQLAHAVQLYHDAHRRLPLSQFLGSFGKGAESTAWSWLAKLLPHVEQANLATKGRVPTATLRDSGLAAERIESYLCPSDSFAGRGVFREAGDLTDFEVGQTNYQAVCGANWGHDKSQGKTDIGSDWDNPGTNGLMDGLAEGDGLMCRSDAVRVRTLRQVVDGTSHTFVIGEQLPEKNRWCAWPYANGTHATCAIPPNVVPLEGRDYSPGWWSNVGGFRSQHGGGLHFAYADGSVHWIADETDLQTYRAMATIAGHESLRVE